MGPEELAARAPRCDESRSPRLAIRLSDVTRGHSLHFSQRLSFFMCEMQLVEHTLWC